MMARGRKSSGERFSKCRRLNFGPLTRLVVLGADDREGNGKRQDFVVKVNAIH